MTYVYPTHLNKHISLSLWDVLNMISKMYGYNTYFVHIVYIPLNASGLPLSTNHNIVH